MNQDPDRKKLATIALALFIAGVPGSFLISILTSTDVVMGFGVICVLLSLVFGIISKNYLFGKIAMIGSLVVIGIAGAQYIIFLNVRSDIESDRKTIDFYPKSRQEERPTESR